MTKLTLRFTIILFSLFSLLSAQDISSINIMGQVLPDSADQVLSVMNTSARLVPYKEGEQAYTAKVDKDGNFNFSVLLNGSRLYDLKYRGMKLSILVSPNQTEYKVIIRADSLEVKSMKIVDSHENDAYRKLRRENNGFVEILRDFRQGLASGANNYISKLQKHISAQNEVMEYIKHAYQGTFTANVLTTISEIPEITGTLTTTQMQQHYFDKIDFKQATIYLTSDLDLKISAYLDFIADSSKEGRKTFLNKLMDKTAGNAEAQKNLLTLILNNFADADREGYLQSLVDWSNERPSLATEQPVLSSKLKLLAGTLPGIKAKDVAGEDISGKPQTLYALLAKNKLNILIFWESDCPHCRKAMPEFIRLYQKYHSRGLEITAVSLDSDKEKWKQFVQNNKLDWQNMLLPSGSSAHADYFIQYTPTMVLIGSDSIIIHRFMEVSDLDAEIAEILGP